MLQKFPKIDGKSFDIGPKIYAMPFLGHFINAQRLNLLIINTPMHSSQ
jgi:hypothetical protein